MISIIPDTSTIMQNYKELIKDLCARMPFGVKVAILGSGAMDLSSISKCDLGWFAIIDGAPTDFGIDEIKPYLRSMSSMTEEEILEYNIAIDKDIEPERIVDWYYAHYLDFRGLIPMGLAIEAPEGMYNKNK